MSKRLMTHLSRKMARNTTATPADRETRTVTLTRSDVDLVARWLEGTLSDHGHVMDPNEAAHMREVVHKIKAAR